MASYKLCLKSVRKHLEGIWLSTSRFHMLAGVYSAENKLAPCSSLLLWAQVPRRSKCTMGMMGPLQPWWCNTSRGVTQGRREVVELQLLQSHCS